MEASRHTGILLINCKDLFGRSRWFTSYCENTIPVVYIIYFPSGHWSCHGLFTSSMLFTTEILTMVVSPCALPRLVRWTSSSPSQESRHRTSSFSLRFPVLSPPPRDGRLTSALFCFFFLLQLLNFFKYVKPHRLHVRRPLIPGPRPRTYFPVLVLT